MSGTDADEYLSDGMSEEIIAALSKVSGLRVAARTSSFFFKGKNEAIEKIGAQLHVGSVLEGSVRKAQGLKEVVVVSVNQGDSYGRFSESARHFHAAKPGANNKDMGKSFRVHCCLCFLDAL